MKTEQSKNYFERAIQTAPGGVHSPVRGFRGVGGNPIFIKKAYGSKLLDVDGNEYLDFCLSWGPLLFGHSDQEIKEAVLLALENGWTYGAAETVSLELAELICSEIPWVEKVRFVNSGTEAVMAALRLARGATGRSIVLKFDGCYHGHVDSMLVKAGSGLAEMASPDSAGVSKAVAGETLVCPLNDLKALEKIFEERGNEIAAVIVEPIPANNGLLIPEKVFLPKIIQLCKTYGSVSIFDEVITGFRMGLQGMAGVTGLSPDLVTYGKIIGGGFPVGAYGGKKALMDLVAPLGPVYQAGTLSANPVAMSAGLAMLKKIIRTKPYLHLENKVSQLVKNLNQSAFETGVFFQSAGSMFWGVCYPEKNFSGKVVQSISEIPESQKSRYAKTFHRLLQSGIYLAPSGFEVSFISTAHTDDDLRFFHEKFVQAAKL